MKIKLNEQAIELAEGASLADLIRQQDISPNGIAIAIGYRVVPKVKWEETILTEGMELMLVQAVSGG